MLKFQEASVSNATKAPAKPCLLVTCSVCRVVLGCAFPAYMTHKAVSSGNTQQLRHWCIYWQVRIRRAVLQPWGWRACIALPARPTRKHACSTRFALTPKSMSNFRAHVPATCRLLMGFFMCVEWLADLSIFWWVGY